jgi:hypothetical protein
MLGKYSGVGSISKVTTDAIRIDLTRNISKVLFDLQDEVRFAFDREIGASCPEWTEIPVYAKLLQVVALLSGRTFVGLPLCRDKEWTDATINFTVDLGRAVGTISNYHRLIRPLVRPFLPEVHRLRAYREFAGRKLKPHADAILAARGMGNGATSTPGQARKLEKVATDDGDQETASGKSNGSENFSMIHWILDRMRDISNADAVSLGKEQMLVAFAAVHTTSMAISQAIFDLAAHPEYASELRDEIEAVIREDGYTDGMLRKASVPKLKKLDSFIKESQRETPPGVCTCCFTFLSSFCFSYLSSFWFPTVFSCLFSLQSLYCLE